MYTYGNTMLFGSVLVIIILIFATVSFNAACGTRYHSQSEFLGHVFYAISLE